MRNKCNNQRERLLETVVLYFWGWLTHGEPRSNAVHLLSLLSVLCFTKGQFHIYSSAQLIQCIHTVLYLPYFVGFIIVTAYRTSLLAFLPDM